MAEWLNITFHDFDYAILNFFHELALKYDGILRPISEIFNTIGTMPFLVLCWFAFGLFLFSKKHKRDGLALACGTLVALILGYAIVKVVVARPRPYSEINDIYDWWVYVGSHVENDYSFPSGHVIAAMASVTCWFCDSKNKKVSWLAYIYVVIMAFTRNYLMVHYPTDVIGALILGLLCGIIAHYIVVIFYIIIKKIPNFILSRFVLTGTLKKQTNNDKQQA